MLPDLNIEQLYMDSWTLGKAMKKNIAAFEMWCWQRMLWVQWTAKRSNASVLAEINEIN